MPISSKRKYTWPDTFFTAIFFVLIFWGLIILGSASSNFSNLKFGDSFYMLKKQIVFGFLIGLAGFFLALKIPYKNYKKIAPLLLIGSISLLVLVFTPLGLTIKGSARWVDFKLFSFQPSEVAKFLSIIYFAYWFSKKNTGELSFKEIIPFFIILGTILTLLFLEPATSVAVIIFLSSFAIYFFAGARFSHVAASIACLLLILGGIIYSTPYRFSRIQGFFNSQEFSQTSGFHIDQAMIAIGSGRLTGVGFGQSTTKLRFLPEPYGDSIFAVLSEEFGFLGSIFTILLFGLLILRIFILAKKIPDKFGSYLLIGFGSMIGIQAFINIAAISGLIPLTGMPLPFISYGGTALAVFMTISGIIANVSKSA